MKKTILSISLIFITLLAVAQDFTGTKFCINPGHGGHDGDDRFMEETGFYESDGNLTKGLYMKDIFVNCGATVVMSRTTNDSSDDLPLSQIAGIANDNNVDFFHAIHSNGLNGQMNYPLMLFRGYDTDPVFDQAKEMGEIMWHKLYENGAQCWTQHNLQNRGDWSFYDWGTSGLGVLRPLTMPGVLSEGSFHDYIPESWRLQNTEYRKLEAISMASAFVEFFDKTGFEFGTVAGIARDQYNSPEYHHNASTKDIDVPVNNIKVTLNPTGLVYEGDNYNNGFYFFDSIPAGDYTLIIEAEDFYVYTSSKYILFLTQLNHVQDSLQYNLGLIMSNRLR